MYEAFQDTSLNFSPYKKTPLITSSTCSSGLCTKDPINYANNYGDGVDPSLFSNTNKIKKSREMFSAKGGGSPSIGGSSHSFSGSHSSAPHTGFSSSMSKQSSSPNKSSQNQQFHKNPSNHSSSGGGRRGRGRNWETSRFRSNWGKRWSSDGHWWSYDPFGEIIIIDDFLGEYPDIVFVQPPFPMELAPTPDEQSHMENQSDTPLSQESGISDWIGLGVLGVIAIGVGYYIYQSQKKKNQE